MVLVSIGVRLHLLVNVLLRRLDFAFDHHISKALVELVALGLASFFFREALTVTPGILHDLLALLLLD